jgi:hypothetical protein
MNKKELNISNLREMEDELKDHNKSVEIKNNNGNI